MKILVALLWIVALSFAQPPNDLITNLPGLQTPVNFPMYAGYLSATGDRHYFYFFIQSAGNPATDPVILWLNGGPGCSSLLGLFTENGPFSPDQNGNLVINPYAWNNVASVLYIESPAGVGFSYCDNGCPTFDDNLTANDNYNVLVDFFNKYPKFAQNDFYIFGESYAGHYIPQLVLNIYKNGKSNPPGSNFKGFGAGNPLSDEYYDLDGPYLAQYMQYHGMIRLDDTNTQASGNYDPYDILVDVCNSKRMANYIRFPHPFNNFKGAQETKKRYVPNPPACIEDYTTSYLNNAQVQSAIHVQATQWTECGGPNYNFGTDSMIPIYQMFMNSTTYKMMVYSGDMDTVLNFYATEKWIMDMKRPVVEPWKAWTYQSPIGNGVQVAGWTIKFKGLRFTTVKGAGHMVPGYTPAPALQMLKNFLSE